MLGHCTFRWWLEYPLRLRDQTADDLPLVLGRLRHVALEYAVKQAVGSAGDPREAVCSVRNLLRRV